ncbi:hypothetical protein [Nitrospirillum iridis]|uniref:Scaffolding protein n=1 Tax=Nitrospirillum iridis TaxID=765888 RepID=A0A7X0AZJ1_9PROT|nr:hypothetical protein [Nitrospirillum iridis]MBB6253027.1 hypothetical protein [Nitrospirillum iridis]
MNDISIHPDEIDTSTDAAVEALLQQFEDRPTEGATDTAPAEDATTPGVEPEGTPEAPEPAPAEAVPDDLETEIEVDGQKHRVAVKDLKRLWGQEAALTRKAQETAAARKAAEDATSAMATRLDALVQRARSEYEPFAKVDLFMASREMDPTSFQALRQAMQKAEDNLRFVEREASAVMAEQQAQAQHAYRERAKAALEVLPTLIPEWSSDHYGTLRDYAVTSGFTADEFHNVTDPRLIQLVHKARAYDQAQAKAAAAVTTAKKVPTAPLRPSATAPTTTADTRATDALKRLRSTGSTDDAVAALMGRWAD